MAPDALDATLQATPLWRVLKRDYPDWYAERLKEIAALAADNKDDAAIGQQMARALVALRRQNVGNALGAGFPQLKAVASTFYENLVQLGKYSNEACFEFISKGEAGPLVVSLMQNPAYTARLQAQVVAVFEAIADGRKAARAYPQPRKTDYDALAADLAKLGWSQADLQLFSDERALARAGPEKVCQLVRDWFAAQLALKDRRHAAAAAGGFPEADRRRLSARCVPQAWRERPRVNASHRTHSERKCSPRLFAAMVHVRAMRGRARARIFGLMQNQVPRVGLRTISPGATAEEF